MGKSWPEAGGPHLRIFRDKRGSYCPNSGPAALEAQRCGLPRHEIRRLLIEPHHDLDAALRTFARPAGRMRHLADERNDARDGARERRPGTRQADGDALLRAEIRNMGFIDLGAHSESAVARKLQ